MTKPRSTITTAAKSIIGRLAELQQEVEVPEPYVLTNTITITAPTRRQMREIVAAKGNEELADKAFFGEHYDALNELFDDRPQQEWAAFVQEISEHFFGKGSGEVPGKSPDSSE